MVPIDRPSRRLRTIFAGAVVVASAVMGLAILAQGSAAPSSQPGGPGEVGGVGASLPIPSFPSVAPILPWATPGMAATIPIVRPEFPYVGREPWQLIHTPGAGRLIEGFASAPSYLPGQTLRLAVSTSGASYRVSIFRVSGTAPPESPFVRVAELPSQAGHLQAAPVVDPVTKMVRAPWSYSAAYPIPPDWPSGVYVARLESDQDVQSYVPFVVRSVLPTKFLLVSSALTWQAYNDWGGANLYKTGLGDPLPGVTRALAVSFDRPYTTDGGAGQLFAYEVPMIAWFLRQHLDVSFTTDYDLSVDPASQPLPRAVIFNGHSEYWGVALRVWLDQHVLGQGDLSLGVFAADSGYWPVVLTGSGPEGPRVLTCYKDGPLPDLAAPGSPGTPEPAAARETPLASGADEEKVPSMVPVGPLPPTGPYLGPYVGSFDVHSLMGVDYQHVTTAMANYTLSNPLAPPSLLDGTGIVAGAPLGFFAGGEVDASDRGPGAPSPDSATGVVVAGAYGIPSRHGATSAAEAVYRPLANGAQVFASGTFYWGWALDPGFAVRHHVASGFDRLTLNLLTLLAR